MGTSASNGGPKGNPPLLPPWYNDNNFPTENNDDINQPDENFPDDENGAESPDNDEVEAPEQPAPVPNISKDWGKAKGALTRRSNNTGGSSSRKAGSNYLKSLGGVSGAVRAAAQGIRIGGIFADFLGAASTEGIENALTGIGLQQFIGRPFDEVCAAIANMIAPVGTTNDESVARDALISTLDSLYAKIEEEESEFSLDLSLSLEQVKETLIEFVSNFVFTKWMYELGIAIERGSVTESEAIELEGEVKELVYVETIEHYRNVDIANFNLNQRGNQLAIEGIFRTAYSTLEL
jgi:hypothetical protein